MSSYVLDVASYQKAEIFLNGVLFDDRMQVNHPYALRELAERLNYWYTPSKTAKLIRCFYRLNCNATNVRYRWDNGKYIPGEYTPQECKKRPSFEEYLKLCSFFDCALYQCGESRYTDKKIYKLFSFIRDELKKFIPHYQAEPLSKTLYDQYTKWGEL